MQCIIVDCLLVMWLSLSACALRLQVKGLTVLVHVHIRSISINMAQKAEALHGEYTVHCIQVDHAKNTNITYFRHNHRQMQDTMHIWLLTVEILAESCTIQDNWQVRKTLGM